MISAVIAPFYAVLYPTLCEIARSHGYSLAIHGTLGRDLDLIATPWTDEATDALTLITSLKAATATVTHTAECDHYFKDHHPSIKPHGRLAYSLHLTDNGAEGPYIDVSVMPRVLKPDEATIAKFGKLKVFTLCPKCNQESQIKTEYNNAGHASNFHTCPFCLTHIDTWLRIPLHQ